MLMDILGFSFFSRVGGSWCWWGSNGFLAQLFFPLSVSSLKSCNIVFPSLEWSTIMERHSLKTLIALVRVPSSWSMENSPPSVKLVLASLSFSWVRLSDLHSYFLLFFIWEQIFSLSLIDMLPFILFIICCSGLHEGGWSWLRHSVGWRPTWLKFMAVASYYYAVPAVLILRKRHGTLAGEPRISHREREWRIVLLNCAYVLNSFRNPPFASK